MYDKVDLNYFSLWKSYQMASHHLKIQIKLKQYEQSVDPLMTQLMVVTCMCGDSEKAEDGQLGISTIRNEHIKVIRR